jgi:hypothetical protein
MNTLARTLHLLDIENLCDRAIVTALQVEDALTDYQRVVGIDNNDLVVIAANTTNAPTAYLTAHKMLSAQFLSPTEGKDAADLALIEAVTTTPNITSFDTVIIASGDHIFAPTLANLAAQGVNTVAVGRTWSISPQVRMAAHSTIKLPHLTSTHRATVIDIATGKEIA